MVIHSRNLLLLTLATIFIPHWATASIVTNLQRTRGSQESSSIAVWAYYADPTATYVTKALCPHGLDWSQYSEESCRGDITPVDFVDFFSVFANPNFVREHLRLVAQKKRIEKGLKLTRLFSKSLKNEQKKEDRAFSVPLVRLFEDSAAFQDEALRSIDESIAAHLRTSRPAALLYEALTDKVPHLIRANVPGEPELRHFVRQFPRSFQKAETLKGNQCAQEIPGEIETREGGCWFQGTNIVYGRVEKGAHPYDTLNWTVEGGVERCAATQQGGVWGWRPPTVSELTALVEARVAPFFVRGPELTQYFVTISEQTSQEMRKRDDDLGGIRLSTGSETVLVGTMPGSNLDAYGRHPLPVFADMPTFEELKKSRNLSYSFEERRQMLVQLSTGNTKAISSFTITKAEGTETTTTEDFITRPKYNLPGQGEFGGPLLKGSVEYGNGKRQSQKDASDSAMTFAIADLPRDISVNQMALMCVHDLTRIERRSRE